MAVAGLAAGSGVGVGGSLASAARNNRWAVSEEMVKRKIGDVFNALARSRQQNAATNVPARSLGTAFAPPVGVWPAGCAG